MNKNILFQTLSSLIIFMIIVPAVLANSELPITAKQYHEQIAKLWKQNKAIYEVTIKKSGENPFALYSIQSETNNLLKYTGYCQKYALLDELISLYLLAFDTLITTDKYLYVYYPGYPKQSVQSLAKKYRMWVDKQKPLGQENILISAQFLYVLPETISIIVDIKKEKRTPMMQESLRSFIPLLLEHYERWVLNSPGPFQVRAWGCRYNGQDVPTGLNHSELLNMKMDKKLGDRKSPSHCNMVTDTDMWIIAGVINILAAHKKEKESVPITYEEYNNMLAYAKTGVNLLENRFSYTNLENFEGNKIIGAVFDVGIGDDRPGHAFAGYSGREFPKTVRADKSKFHKKGVGWDLSHARRFVHVFETIIKSTDILGLKISSKELAEKMANQLIYATFNRDFKKPLFTNYMDGTNGWYRVDYSGKAGFAYGPWDMSIAVMTGGYGFWSKYNVDVERVFVAFFRMLESTDSDVRQHVIDHYETSHWSQYRRKSGNDFKNLDDQKTQSLLIQFLPSICLIIR